MSKYIDAEKCEEYFYEHMDDKAMEIAMIAINEIPTADVVKVRHGRWEKVDDNPYEYVGMCSVCRNEIKQPTCMLKPIYSYCPICGALMDKDKE